MHDPLHGGHASCAAAVAHEQAEALPCIHGAHPAAAEAARAHAALLETNAGLLQTNADARDAQRAPARPLFSASAPWPLGAQATPAAVRNLLVVLVVGAVFLWVLTAR